MKKHYPLYFKSISPPYFYKKSFISLTRSHFKIFIPLLRGDANYGFIYRNKYPSLHFIFTPPSFHPILRVLLQSSLKVILLLSPQFMKIWKNIPLLIPPPTTIKPKRVTIQTCTCFFVKEGQSEMY